MYEVMTTGQLAEYLQLDEQTVYRKAKRGEIPSVHIGRTLRFKKDLIDTWLRLSSLRWADKKHQRLYTWAKNFAKKKGMTEASVQKAIDERRKQA